MPGIGISIMTVNIDSPDWAELFVKSIRKFTKQVEHEIVVLDNGSLKKNLSWLKEQKDVQLVCLDRNHGHGPAVDIGLRIARYPIVCVLDVDSHVQRDGWETDLLNYYDSSDGIKFIGCKGPPHKPLKPPLFFFERDFIIDNNLSFKHVPGVSTDTAQKLYHDITGMGYEVERIAPGHKIYPCYGDQFYLNDKPLFYHHWYGTRFCEHRFERTKTELDGYQLNAYLENKRKLFDQGLVRDILGN